jgi:hypothetical protein
VVKDMQNPEYSSIDKKLLRTISRKIAFWQNHPKKYEKIFKVIQGICYFLLSVLVPYFLTVANTMSGDAVLISWQYWAMVVTIWIGAFAWWMVNRYSKKSERKIETKLNLLETKLENVEVKLGNIETPLIETNQLLRELINKK